MIIFFTERYPIRGWLSTVRMLCGTVAGGRSSIDKCKFRFVGLLLFDYFLFMFKHAGRHFLSSRKAVLFWPMEQLP